MSEKEEKDVKERALSNRELILIKHLADGQTPREAAKSAGYSDTYIKANLNKIVGKERIKRTIVRAMKAQGLTEDRLMENLAAGLEADKVIICNGSPMNVPDWSNRRHYLRMSLELLNVFPDKTMKVEASKETLEELIKAVQKKQEKDITPPYVVVEDN